MMILKIRNYKLEINSSFLKIPLSLLILIGLIFSSYFAITRAYTPGDTTGVKKVMPPPYSDPALVGYWKLDDNAASTTVIDSSGNGNNGTAQANTNTLSTTDAIHNRAMTFNGSSDYVDIDAVNSAINTSAGTVGMWLKRDFVNTVGGSQMVISSRVNSDNNIEIFYNKSSNNWEIKYKAGGTTTTVTPAADDIAKDVWTHVVLTWDAVADEVKGYINGVQSGSTVTGLGTWAGSISGTAIGAEGISNNSFFNGSIDDVRIYDRALTASEVAALYQAGRQRTGSVGFSKMLYPPIDQSVVGWWKLNDNAANTTVKDWTSNGNTGTAQQNTSVLTTTGPTGTPNTALTFNGTSDKINMGDVTALNSATMFTISWWHYSNLVSSYIFSKVDEANVSTTLLSMQQWSSGRDYIHIAGTASVGYFYRSSAGIVANTWQLYTLVYDGSGASNADKLKFYVNGKGVTMSYSGTIPTSTANLATFDFDIGEYISTDHRWFPGKLSDFRIYNRALSANEVKRLYMAEAPFRW